MVLAFKVSLILILMYLAAPCWFGFVLLGLMQAFGFGFGSAIETLWDPASVALAIGMLAVMLGMTFAPKIFGFLDILAKNVPPHRVSPAPLSNC